MSVVTAVSLGRGHHFSKPNVLSIRLLAGLGVDGDAHAGVTVKHRSRVRRDPTQPNLRQVHLVHSELFDELREKGFVVVAGDIGENVTTRGIDLLRLPTGTRLLLGDTATVEITRLRPEKHLADLATTCTTADGAVICRGRALVLVKDVGA